MVVGVLEGREWNTLEYQTEFGSKKGTEMLKTLYFELAYEVLKITIQEGKRFLRKL